MEVLKISDLLIRYFRAVDDKQLTLPIIDVTFTNDARILRPNGSALVGHKEIFEGQIKSFGRFKATHHVTTDHVVDINEGMATLQANLTAMHLWGDADNPALNDKYFLAGGVLTLKAIKVDDIWRFFELKNRNIWRTGDGMSEMANYERPKN